MLFNSPTFFVFLVVVFYTYWRLEDRFRNYLLLIANYVFYAWWSPWFALLMFGLSGGNYLIAERISRSDNSGVKKLFLGLSLLLSLGVLATFKYANFFLDILSVRSGLEVILPVGISFYTFQILSYVIDVYRGDVQPSNPLVFFVFSSFFPQLLSGPIGRANHLLRQFMSSRQFKTSDAIDGVKQIILGLFKKVVIADTLAIAVNHAYMRPDLATGAELMLATFFFAFQIYADFSGYSDIAIGSAKLLGIELDRNFAYPYFSRSIAEFWRRWHMSLSFYIRDYVYFPLVYSKKKKTRIWLYFVTVLTFVIIGLWHGAGWNYVVMGYIFGLYLVLGMIWQDARRVLRKKQI